jgi:predicted AlkP superfamily phosphohydrolase/phosphomutase
MSRRSQAPKRLFVLGLDGVPCDLVRAGTERGRFRNLARLGEMVSIRSTVPPISSVAWATFSTGVNPARHGIFGFVERDPRAMRERIPTARDLRSPSLWRMMNDAGLRTIALGVPPTYPPEAVDGILVSCFLCSDLGKGVHPPSLLPRLLSHGYRTDADASLAAQDRGAYFEDLLAVFRARRQAILDLLREPWDLFVAHVMETDRVNHVFFADGADPTAEFHDAFWNFYDEVDRFVGEVEEALPEGAPLLVLSDHGFARTEEEVDVNAALAEGDFFRLREDGEGLTRLDPSSLAYSLPPGRVYLSLAGREKDGIVPPTEYEAVRERIAAFLAGVRDAHGTPVVDRVVLREKAFTGPCFDQAPDLVLLPRDGIELKARFTPGPISSPPTLRTGTHTYDGAFAVLRGRRLATSGFLLDLTPTVFELLDLPVPAHLEGHSLLVREAVRA